MKKRQGFTLVEILVALTIFAIAAVSIFVVFPASSLAIHEARMYTDLGLLLERELAQVRATSFADLAVGETVITQNLPAFVTSVRRTVTADAVYANDLKHAEITIAYISKGQARTDTLRTAVVNRS